MLFTKPGRCALIIIGLMAFLHGCYPTRSLPRGTWLLKSNTVQIAGPTRLSTDQFEPIIKQPVNRNIGFHIPPFGSKSPAYRTDIIIARINLRAYNLGKKGTGKIFQYLQNRVGEAPVLYDTNLTRRTIDQFGEFLNQKGHFNHKITVHTRYDKRKKMVQLSYQIVPGPCKNIRKIMLLVDDPYQREIFELNQFKSLLKPGDPYDYNVLESERQRIVSMYQNQGFFEFTREHVRFDIDTSLSKNQLDIAIQIKNPIIRNDSGTYLGKHIFYVPEKIYIYPNYDFFSNSSYTDTIVKDNIYIIYNGKLNINPKLIYHNLFFNNNHYSARDADVTYKSFASLNLYRNIRIEFKKTAADSTGQKLDGFIYLSPLKRNSFSTEARLETRSANGNGSVKSTYNLGVSGNLTFQRRNAFKNGEILKLSIHAGLEPFFLTDSSAGQNFFNTTEIGPTLSVSFPRFLLPISQDRFAKSARAKTTIAATYNTLKNTDITRKASKISLSYEWNESIKKIHIVNPVELSFVNAQLSNTINQRLIELGDPFLRNTYSNQYIQASSYSFIYSDQYNSKSSKAIYNRSKIEAAGNLLRKLAERNPNWNKDEQGYLIGRVPFAQYIKIENEFKTYRQTFFRNVVAFRLYGGIAKPLQNLGSLPFEKSYFAGGTNGIRAWGARSLGPGSYFDSTSFRGYLNRLGEIHLEANIEYRFKITKLLEWAFFADAGNIWVIKERGGRSGTEFSSSFYKQIALGAGFGARMDFDFVVLRVDLAFPMHDPSKPEGERWISQEKTSYNEFVSRYNSRNQLSGKSAVPQYGIKPNLNIGIGYPF